MNNLHYYYNVVENAMAKLGLNPQTARQKKAGQWTITKGQIPVWIDIFYYEIEKRIYFQVVAPVMKLPEQNQEKMGMELLAINHQLFGVAFCIHKDQVLLKTIREAEGLDSNEVYAMILRAGNYAEKYKKELAVKYPNWMKANFNDLPENMN